MLQGRKRQTLREIHEKEKTFLKFASSGNLDLTNFF